MPRPLNTLWIGERTSADLLSRSVFSSSSSVPASGENNGLEVAAESAFREASADVLRIGVHGAKVCIDVPVVGDEGAPRGGGEPGDGGDLLRVYFATTGVAANWYIHTFPEDTFPVWCQLSPDSHQQASRSCCDARTQFSLFCGLMLYSCFLQTWGGGVLSFAVAQRAKAQTMTLVDALPLHMDYEHC